MPCCWATSIFNTKKVRLKHQVEPAFEELVRRFQYQKGAIKTIDLPTRSWTDLWLFNTKKVRLKPRPFKEQNRLLKGIISDWNRKVKSPESSTSGYP